MEEKTVCLSVGLAGCLRKSSCRNGKNHQNARVNEVTDCLCVQLLCHESSRIESNRTEPARADSDPPPTLVRAAHRPQGARHVGTLVANSQDVGLFLVSKQFHLSDCVRRRSVVSAPQPRKQTKIFSARSMPKLKQGRDPSIDRRNYSSNATAGYSYFVNE